MDSHLNIVIVEDNDDLRYLLHREITKEGYEVALASCAEELDDLATKLVFNLIILDVNLPGENGFDIARRFRQSNPSIYIIMMTARGGLEDKVFGYQQGADLYIPKPVAGAELIAAIKGIERRLATDSAKSPAVLNVRKMALSYIKTVDLSRTEVVLLKALIESASGNLPYFRLHELCGDSVDGKSKAALEVRFVRLRKKMAEAGLGENAIRALRNEGYQLTRRIRVQS